MSMPAASDETGRASAMVVYILYLLSIPSLAVFALVGVAVALWARAGAGPLARQHLDDQIRVWFVAFWWAVVLAIAWVIGLILTVVLVGFAVWWLIGIVAFVVMLWFTFKSALGLIALLDGRGR